MLESLVVRDATSEDDVFNNTLQQLRSQIDILDENIMYMLASRMKVSRSIGALKKENNVAIVQPARWDVIMEKAKVAADNYGIDPEFVKRVFTAIHDASVKEQNK